MDGIRAGAGGTCRGGLAWPSVAGIAAVAATFLVAGCSGDCCVVDSFPIALERAPVGDGSAGPGGLLAWARSDSVNGGQMFQMSIDTGAPLTVFSGPADGTIQTMARSFDILDATAAQPPRALFAGLNVLQLPLGAAGDPGTRPAAVLGGDLLRGYSVEFQFARPAMTFWANQRADDGFLEDVGYAVIHFTPFGGGEVTAEGNPDFLGLRGPLEIPPTRIVFRACAAPPLFDPETSPRENCCVRGDELRAAGTPLSLVLATGVGPLVLSRSAWDRILLPSVPVEVEGTLSIPTSADPIPVHWTTLPAAAHLALVNQEASAATDPGPCVELGRARRLEWVAYRQAKMPDQNFCVQPCDTDPRDTQKAQNSAAYVEIGGQAGGEIPVAIVADDHPLLQGLRTDVRPEGPEVDGIIGAGVLAHTRAEIDYRGSSNRVIFSCDGKQPRDLCWTGARCPRLPDRQAMHACFDLPLAGLPAVCAPSGC